MNTQEGPCDSCVSSFLRSGLRHQAWERGGGGGVSVWMGGWPKMVRPLPLPPCPRQHRKTKQVRFQEEGRCEGLPAWPARTLGECGLAARGLISPHVFLPPGGCSAEIFISMQGLVALSIDVRSIYFYRCCWKREKVRSLQSPFICMIPSSPGQPTLWFSHLSSPRLVLRGEEGRGSPSPGEFSLPPHTGTQAHRHMSSQVTPDEAGSLPPVGFFKGLGGGGRALLVPGPGFPSAGP